MTEKILVVYYSRTGNTKKLAQKLAQKSLADIDEIVDLQNRSGVLGFLKGGRDAFRKKRTEINYDKNPENYDVVVIGTPVWVGTMAPAVKSYLEKHALKNVAFFCTYGGQPANTFKDMQSLTTKPVAVLGVKANKFEEHQKYINGFINKLKNGNEPAKSD